MLVHGVRASKLRTYVNISLLTFVMLGSFLRFAGLGKESIWLDEATSIIIARMSLPSVIAWAAGDIHPPLYYIALHFWLTLGENEFCVRALSVMLGVFTITIIYKLASELFDLRVGLYSALLLALAPLHIWYSQETRMYVMVTALSLLSSYFLLLALQREQISYWLGYALTSVLALYTHYFALFVSLFQNLFALYWCWSRRGSKRLLIRWLITGLVTALLFFPWIPILYHQATTGGGGWVEKSIGRPSFLSLVDTWFYFNIGLDRQLYPMLLRRIAHALFGICVLSALSRLFPPRETVSIRIPSIAAQREGVLFCTMYLVIPLLTVWLLSQVKPMYTIRYLLPFLPPYSILVAAGLNGLRRNWVRAAVILSLMLTLLVGNWKAWYIEQNPDWRGVSFHVLERAREGDVVLFSPRWNAKPFDYYAKGRVETSMDIPIPVTFAAAQRVVADIASRYQRVWLVWEQGHYSDPEGIVKQVLDSQFEVMEMCNFRGVGNLVLYDLRRSRQSASWDVRQVDET